MDFLKCGPKYLAALELPLKPPIQARKARMQTFLSFVPGSFQLWWLGYALLKNFSFSVQVADVGYFYC